MFLEPAGGEGVSEFVISLEGDGRLKKLLGQNWRQVFTAGALATGKEIEARMKSYPPRRHGIPVVFVSARQRRYFFWALKSGEITVPYRRSGTLGRRWYTKALSGEPGAIVGNPTPYAPFVQAAAQQSEYHRQVPWQTEKQVVTQAQQEGLLRRAMETAIREALGA